MDYRLRHLPEASWRIVRRKAGGRLDEGLRKLIELWAADQVDPFTATAPPPASAAPASASSAKCPA